MSAFWRTREPEERSLSYSDVWGSGGDVSVLHGDSINTALSLVPVYSATALVADAFASSPWGAYDKSGDVPTRLKDQPELLTDPGVRQMDLYSWKFQAASSVLLRGNAYGLIVNVDRRGIPSKIEWIHPDRMTVDDITGQFYLDGRPVPRADLIHIPGYVVPGKIQGLSPLGLFRMQVETGIEAQKFGKSFFKRGGVPTSLLKNSNRELTSEQADTHKKRFVASVSSSEPFVVGKDWDYTAIAIPSGDAQFLAGIKATATQIASVYRVAPEDVGGETSSSSLTYKSLEQDQIRFAQRTLRPWASRFEAVFDRYLPSREYVRFNLDASARADLKTRYEAHQIAIDAGFETDDEVRALEEMQPLTATQRAQQAAKQRKTTTQTRSHDA